MSSKFSILALVAAGLVIPALTQADPWKNESGKGRGGHKVEEKYDPRTGEYKYEEKGPSYKYEYKVDRHGGRSVEYKGRGGPPPWAGAHGHPHSRPVHTRGDTVYIPPFGIDAGRCNRELLGAAVGGAAGGFLGSKLGKGDGKLATTAAGAVIGVLVGGAVGRAMDQVDQSCVGQILEHAPDGREIIWSEGTRGQQYNVVPTGTYRTLDGSYCREYQSTAVVGGEQQRVYGTACRQPDGSWKLVS